jgi:hypothetical protein
MSVALVGRITAVLCVGLGLVSACAGHSVRTSDDDGAADDGSGDDGFGDDGSGDGGELGGSGGIIAVGGAAPSGGGGYGGTGYGGDPATGGLGGAVAMGGASGSVSVGGAGPCPECPPWEYGLAVEGDGAPYAMNFNGHIVYAAEDPAPPICSEQPLRGSVGGCGGLFLAACQDPENGPPCLEVSGSTARYLDRQTGRLWTGVVTSYGANPSIPGVASGVLTLELSNSVLDASLVLTVDYSICTDLVARIVCK